MALTVRATPTFERLAKKLHARDKKTLDDAIRKMIKTPKIGEEKKGDLTGVFVHKFKMNKQELLLSYKFEPDAIVLLSLGSHENFTAISKDKITPPPLEPAVPKAPQH